MSRNDSNLSKETRDEKIRGKFNANNYASAKAEKCNSISISGSVLQHQSGSYLGQSACNSLIVNRSMGLGHGMSGKTNVNSVKSNTWTIGSNGSKNTNEAKLANTPNNDSFFYDTDSKIIRESFMATSFRNKNSTIKIGEIDDIISDRRSNNQIDILDQPHQSHIYVEGEAYFTNSNDANSPDGSKIVHKSSIACGPSGRPTPLNSSLNVSDNTGYSNQLPIPNHLQVKQKVSRSLTVDLGLGLNHQVQPFNNIAEKQQNNYKYSNFKPNCLSVPESENSEKENSVAIYYQKKDGVLVSSDELKRKRSVRQLKARRLAKQNCGRTRSLPGTCGIGGPGSMCRGRSGSGKDQYINNRPERTGPFLKSFRNTSARQKDKKIDNGAVLEQSSPSSGIETDKERTNEDYETIDDEQNYNKKMKFIDYAEKSNINGPSPNSLVVHNSNNLETPSPHSTLLQIESLTGAPLSKLGHTDILKIQHENQIKYNKTLAEISVKSQSLSSENILEYSSEKLLLQRLEQERRLLVASNEMLASIDKMNVEVSTEHLVLGGNIIIFMNG